MAEYYRAFREVAVKHERTGNGRDSLFILSETDNAENFRLMTFYDLDDDEVPTYRIMDTRTHNKYGHGLIYFRFWQAQLTGLDGRNQGTKHDNYKENSIYERQRYEGRKNVGSFSKCSQRIRKIFDL